MTAETNKIVMRRFLEFINTASESLAQELISPDAIFHVPGSPEPMRGPAGYLAIIGLMRGGFPVIPWTLEEMVAEGDKVAARFTMRGTHRGTFFGVPPTGRIITVQGPVYLPYVWRIRRSTWSAGYAWTVATDRHVAISLENCRPVH